MYSVMLAAMLTTTSATPEWGCYGCHGCYGCTGYSSWHGCHGCSGCYGYNAFSSSCYGCAGCWGCHGCCGGVMVYSSCHGCCGGCWGCHGGVIYSSCHGCCGGVVVSPPVSYYTPAPGHPGASTREKALEEQIRELKERLRKLESGKPKKPDEVSAPAPAHVVVKLPKDARLFVDDTACPLTSATRSFDTPELSPGQAYYYTLKAEVTRDGRAVTESKRVVVRAGEETVVEFGDMRPAQTASR